jgi:hypothetical protein
MNYHLNLMSHPISPQVLLAKFSQLDVSCGAPPSLNIPPQSIQNSFKWVNHSGYNQKNFTINVGEQMETYCSQKIELNSQFWDLKGAGFQNPWCVDETLLATLWQ